MDQQPTHQAAAGGFNFADFLSFRKMITLQIIQIVYIIVAILITLGGLFALFGGGRNDYGYSSGLMPGGPVYGLIMIVFGNIIWRMWCELIIVFFRINKTLSEVEQNTRK